MHTVHFAVENVESLCILDKGGCEEKQNTSLSLEEIKINVVKQKRAYKANFMKLRITVFFLSVYIQCLIDFWHTVPVSEVF